jgi:hypothetical protein
VFGLFAAPLAIFIEFDFAGNGLFVFA